MSETSKEQKPRTKLRDLPDEEPKGQPAELTEKQSETVKGGLMSYPDPTDPNDPDDPRLP